MTRAEPTVDRGRLGIGVVTHQAAHYCSLLLARVLGMSRRVEEAPDVDLRVPLDVHDEVRKARQRPAPEIGDVKFRGEAGRAVMRVSAYLGDRSLNGPDKPGGDVTARFREVVIECSVDVLGRPPAQANRLGDPSQVPGWKLLRSAAK